MEGQSGMRGEVNCKRWQASEAMESRRWVARGEEQGEEEV